MYCIAIINRSTKSVVGYDERKDTNDVTYHMYCLATNTAHEINNSKSLRKDEYARVVPYTTALRHQSITNR